MAKNSDGRIPMPQAGPMPDTAGHGAHSTSEKHSPAPKSTVTKGY